MRKKNKKVYNMAAEVTMARESKVSPRNATGSPGRADKVISDYRSNYRTTVVGNDGTPMFVTNHTYNLTEKTRREKYPFLQDTGEDAQRRAFDYVVGNSVSGGAKKVAEALNRSGLGETNWKAVDRNDGIIELRSIDPFKNEHRLIIRKRAKNK